MRVTPSAEPASIAVSIASSPGLLRACSGSWPTRNRHSDEPARSAYWNAIGASSRRIMTSSAAPASASAGPAARWNARPASVPKVDPSAAPVQRAACTANASGR